MKGRVVAFLYFLTLIMVGIIAVSGYAFANDLITPSMLLNLDDPGLLAWIVNPLMSVLPRWFFNEYSLAGAIIAIVGAILAVKLIDLSVMAG